MTAIEQKLGRFGHHPEFIDDYCIEVEIIASEWENHKLGFMNGTPTRSDLEDRVFRAMQHGPFITEQCQRAKDILRGVEREMRSGLGGRDRGCASAPFGLDDRLSPPYPARHEEPTPLL